VEDWTIAGLLVLIGKSKGKVVVGKGKKGKVVPVLN
jgi:hypothetical protein